MTTSKLFFIRIVDNYSDDQLSNNPVTFKVTKFCFYSNSEYNYVFFF